ncbi:MULTISPECIES: Xaa-Pro peptidase family protein [unclassified Mesorhizobium]|uniref:M24 family metallopeptidase n=1 Tax=unclassified Mesorhizobium TaxID=325217 RepID=UPI000FD5524E|nr:MULTISPECIES: Xaa-Pro peptidase family protein [unclassified Mesorhizobium]RUV96481.1 aminopeptidase P family protein [Mesorhizobium sp. M5C.F.Ca.IN.020.14.1.1]RUV18702.1 aminopeptidase P family protein [Mesorhizobium sp. M5C.F.Ca.IN.020.32.2.1]RWG50759.1 MAG: aminopeptidase P family protein [Mesorhizobium sp.]RWH55731.1 MAG: aminopeptidase P family protein [Mesorhizobium sp.]RWI67768.1 MAG: aminopeptidase P family protein [Mesorhizobium sp.]
MSTISTSGKKAGQTRFPPPPAVPADELGARLKSIRREMDADGLDLIVLTDANNIQYFTGYRTLHWYYNCRPVFAAITARDLVVFAAFHEKPHVEWKPRAFSVKFYDGYVDEGVRLVADTIRDLFKGKTLRTGIDYGEEMYGRGSLPLIDALRELSTGRDIGTATATLWRVRQIKTRFEADLKRIAFTIADSAFDQTITQAHIGTTEYELWSIMQAQMFLNGADSGDPFPLIFSKGDFTYGRPASDRRLEPGHYIWADFRATYGGYPADRNRIARAGEPEPWELDAYRAVRDMTLELCNSIKVGMTCSEVHAMARKMWEPVSVGQKWLGVKRFGHGGGIGLTEPPSLQATDHTVIRPGMILHVEPKLERDGAVFQFEECIYMREDGIEFLAPLCPENMLIIH